MERHGRLTLLSMTLVASLVAGLAAAETVYVQATTAKLRSGKTSLDPVVAELKFGEALEVLRKEGGWLEVRTAAAVRGWIFANKTAARKPAGGDDLLAKMGRSMRRTEASDVTASAGARGLDKVSEGYAQRVGISQQDRDAVDRMTAYRLTDQEVEDFLKDGRLGEYAQ